MVFAIVGGSFKNQRKYNLLYYLVTPQVLAEAVHLLFERYAFDENAVCSLVGIQQ